MEFTDECCGTCVYYRVESVAGITEWFCANPLSNSYSDYTEYDDVCDDYEEK